METTLVIWIVLLGFFLTHQLEEIVYSIGAWHHDHPTPRWRRWTLYLTRTPMASLDRRMRVRTVARQTVVIVLVAFLASWSLLATQIAGTILIVVLAVAFIMHITVSALTRSAMPGLATSILPGLPGACVLLIWVWNH